MRIASFCSIVLVLLVFEACGEQEDKPYPDVDTETDTGTNTDTDTSTDTDVDTDFDAGSDLDTDVDTDTWEEFGLGDCEQDDDCPDGTCIRIPDEPGGYWTCLFQPESPVTGPSENPDQDLCETIEDCDDPLECDCYLEMEYAGILLPHNECFCDECDQDFECFEGLCIHAGAFGQKRNTCVVAGCEKHNDCYEGDDGRCIPYYDACSVADPRPYAGKYCHYSSDPCIDDSDCAQGNCVPDYDNDNDGFICGFPECS